MDQAEGMATDFKNKDGKGKGYGTLIIIVEGIQTALQATKVTSKEQTPALVPAPAVKATSEAPTVAASASSASSPQPAKPDASPAKKPSTWKPDELKLTIVSTKDLKSGDWFSSNDVFVTVLQDDSKDEVAKTDVNKEKKGEATLNQTFTLSKPSGSLTFTVMDRDKGMFSNTDDPVGMVRFSLDAALKEPGPHQVELRLQDPKDAKGGKLMDQAEGMATDFKNKDGKGKGYGTLIIIVEGIQTVSV